MEGQIDVVWEKALGTIKKRLNAPAFKTFFQNTTPVAIHEGFFIVATANGFTKEWLEARHLNLIRAALSEVTGTDMGVKITVRKGSPRARSDDARAVPATRTDAPRGASSFNPRYTFDSFVVGSGNRFAHAAALAVAEKPSAAYNPLFVYGGAGLGKTHLLHAIGSHSRGLFPDSKVRYLTSEKFTNEFINALKDGSTIQFQNRYRGIDVLLMDDIHFIVDKERTQEEFFHTFNALYEAHKQIVLSSDRPPKEMPTLEDRLRSRFEWGLIADIQPPDLETRVAILRKKAETAQMDVPDDVMLFIAGKIQSNIRELEGALTRLFAFASLTSNPVDLSLAEDVLKEILPESRPREITVKAIQAEVARYFSLSVAELTGANRSRFVVYPRQVAMYLARDLTNASLPKIGELFGGRDHTTVMHANSKVQRLIKADQEAYHQIQEIANRIKQRGS